MYLWNKLIASRASVPNWSRRQLRKLGRRAAINLLATAGPVTRRYMHFMSDWVLKSMDLNFALIFKL